ncbi:DUF342 domain-containing protein [Piscibacillus salipiscarius]|uniref:DUF342 domain-containing protein n=1 Tax=Piscibacillus salipiscarius TaxID=299480 RepID=A0ABW5Q8L1_9BACI|nr:FapA family protein [Piscibacillus salipiscarius]
MDLNKVFQVTVTEDKMSAYLHTLDPIELNKLLNYELNVTNQDLLHFIQEQGVSYGLRYDNIDFIINNLNKVSFPILIAEGNHPSPGRDGYIDFKVEHSIRMELHEQERIDFKNVIKIPVVEPGQLIAIIQQPSEGTAGKDVYDEVVHSRRGKTVHIMAGENTTFDEHKQAIYASNFGQVSLINNQIKVLPLYEVNESLNLSTGNIEFNGSVLIKGDVPEGYRVEAKGDITIEGLVEGAIIKAGGSIYIKEGISATGKGFIEAGVDLATPHINQGHVKAGRHIKVEQSIIHSKITALEAITCQKGHVIGGTISAGSIIVCQDLGNRMHTLTRVYLGENKEDRDHRMNINQQIKQLDSEIEKLQLLGQALSKKSERSPKEQLTLKKQRYTLEEKQLKLKELFQKQEQITDHNENKKFNQILIHGMLYPNVEVTSGKYSRRFNSPFKQASILFDGKEFSLESIE